MLKRSLIISFILMCAFFAFKTSAQVQNGDIVLNISPEYPKANEQVTALVSTYTTDLNSARISWILNGDTVLEGVGKKSFSFTVGTSDFQTNLEVKIETLSGSIIDKKITISPSNLDLLWEAYDTYVPPFYKGKALAPAEGMIKVVAFPNTQNLAGFNYKWKLDDKSQPDSSGYEKNYFVYKNSYLEDSNQIETTASDLFGNNIGFNKITITPGTPKIIFYKRDQNIGTRWENALSDGFVINKNGDVIVAVPYFFSGKDLNSGTLTFDWLLNGEKPLIPNPNNVFPLKPENNTSGAADIKLIINNPKTLFQSMSKEINVNF